MSSPKDVEMHSDAQEEEIAKNEESKIVLEANEIKTEILKTDTEDLEMEPTQEQTEDAPGETMDILDQISETLEKLEKDNMQYELHVQLIDLLKKAEMADELEVARNDMHAVYPLSENLWLDWINDTREQMNGEETDTEEYEAKLREIYNKAEKDYLSIDIWKSFTEFVLEKFNTVSESIQEDDGLIESTREDLCRAVRVTSQHIKRSQEVWREYLQFEVGLMNKFKNPDQIAKVKEVYLLRLSALHIDCEETFNEYSSYITTWDNENYEQNMVEANKIYAKTKSQAAEMDLYEQQLIQQGYSLDAFYQYIEYETKKRNISANNIRCLYERAILIYCTDPGLWEDYIAFLIEHARIVSFLENTCLRSVRNCPWSGVLWSHYIRIKSSEDFATNQVNALVEKALSIPLVVKNIDELVTVLVAKCSYFVRKTDWENLNESDIGEVIFAFEESLAFVEKAFPRKKDTSATIERFYAKILTRFGDIEKAEELWETVVQRNGRSADAWLQYISFHRDLGNYQKCRILFKKCIYKNVDDPARIIDAWETLEREHGDIESYELAFVRIHQRKKRMLRDWQNQAAIQETRKEEIKQKQEDVEQKKESLKRKKGLHRVEQKKRKKAKKETESLPKQPKSNDDFRALLLGNKKE